MVREFQRVIVMSTRTIPHVSQDDPDYVVACVGADPMRLELLWVLCTSSQLIGVEAAGEGLNTDKHGAAISKGAIGILHGMKTDVLQDADGQIQEAHSISAGLDYPVSDPEHAYLNSTGRAQYVSRNR